MNKILIIVHVPSLGKIFEVFIPVGKKVSSTIYLLCKAINELTEGAYKIKEDTIMCRKEDGKAYDLNLTVKQAGLVNGTKVFLI